MREVTAQQLLTEFPIIEKMAQSDAIKQRFCLDNYLAEDVKSAINELNSLYPAYHFEYQEVFGGFGHDLVVTDIAQKVTYDRIPKTRTYGELFQTLAKVYGIHSSAKFHHKPTDRLTEEEFQETIKFYENFDIDTLFSQDDEDKYDES